MIARFVSALCFAALAAGSASASEEKIKVELNKLEPQGGACQAYILIQNKTSSTYSNLSLDLVMFDSNGIISRRLAVEMAPLRAGKTSVKVFGIDGTSCDGISRILVNDVLSCTSDGAVQETCLDRIETASRGSVELIN
ncbi:MAG: hypothetical protein AAF317_01605 [Pseudomonadota bacterium]